MTQDKTGGPAFPSSDYGEFGMTLRDWFAGQADVSNYRFKTNDEAAMALGIDPPFDDSVSEQIRFGVRLIAALKWMEADAMIAARNRGDDT